MSPISEARKMEAKIKQADDARLSLASWDPKANIERALESRRSQAIAKEVHRIHCAAQRALGCTGIETVTDAVDFALDMGGYIPSWKQEIRAQVFARFGF